MTSARAGLDPASVIENPTRMAAASAQADGRLRARLLSFIGTASGDDFDALALEVHHYQYRRNPAYQRFVDRLGAVPRAWREIPAVPAVAFKETTLACAPAERIYESSGTTEGPHRRSRHHIPDLALYRAAALAGFHRAVLPEGERRVFVVAAPERRSHPSSSLGEMVSWLRDRHDDARHHGSFLADGALDVEAFARALDGLDAACPVLVLALTSALLRLDDHARAVGRTWRLPAGSLLVDTGGCKGYAPEIPRAAILERYHATFGVQPGQVINEYGMTEMCSQLYARGAGPHQPPPWVRTVVCDPENGRECPPGQLGILRHVDLANLGSVVAIQTEDLGRAVAGGIELLGRAARAEARGCSLLLTP